MARNPLASLGAGLARGAGNYSSLMLADRLKREAEERALAGRQQLAGEAFEREKELRVFLDELQSNRQIASEERDLQGQAARATGYAQASGVPGVGAAGLLQKPGALEALGNSGFNEILGQLAAAAEGMKAKEAGDLERTQAIAANELAARDLGVEERKLQLDEASTASTIEANKALARVRGAQEGDIYFKRMGGGEPESEPELTPGQAEGLSRDYADKLLRSVIMEAATGGDMSPQGLAQLGNVQPLLDNPEFVLSKFPDLRKWYIRAKAEADRHFKRGEITFEQLDEQFRDDVPEIDIGALAGGEDNANKFVENWLKAKDAVKNKVF